MRAVDIRKGDRLVTDQGAPVYTVEDVWTEGSDVVATVRFTDGGTGTRVWGADQLDIPLVAS